MMPPQYVSLFEETLDDLGLESIGYLTNWATAGCDPAIESACRGARLLRLRW